MYLFFSTCIVSNYCNCPRVGSCKSIHFIQFWLQQFSTYCVYSFCILFFISWSFTLSVTSILIYLNPFSIPVSFISCSFVSLIPSLYSYLSFFITSIPHFSMPNSMSKFRLNIWTLLKGVQSWFWSFAYKFRTPTNSRWFMDFYLIWTHTQHSFSYDHCKG